MSDEVQKWMIGLGFKKTEDGKQWYLQPNGYQKDVLLMYDDEAAFFYQATQREVLEARIDELNKTQHMFTKMIETFENQDEYREEIVGMLQYFDGVLDDRNTMLKRQKGGEDSNE